MSLVTVLVCTRNRPESLSRTVASILVDPAPDIELLVMDQSEDSASRVALGPLSGDPRLRYTPTRARGKGASLNEGLRLAKGTVVACTDDDCVVPSGWAHAMANAMATHPRVAVVFCNVVPEPHDSALGYVPAYQRCRDRLLFRIGDAGNGLGLGAGMALRRDALLSFGGFDEAFGPGARFQSGDDWDLSVRALLHGWQVYDTASTSVLHYGLRTLEEGRTHALRDWVAIGALCAKPIRVGHGSVLSLAARLFFLGALWPPLRDLLHFGRPRGMSRIVGFTKGFVQGSLTPVDRRTLAFRGAKLRSPSATEH